MALQSLVLCNDQEVLRQIRTILHDLGIGVNLCASAQDATRNLAQQKYELAVVDCKAGGTPEVLRSLRQSGANGAAVACLIGPDPQDLDSARDLGTDLVIPRPFALEQAWRSLRTARSLMEGEQRRYFRAPVSVPTRLVLADGREFAAKTRNLSLRGLALEAPIHLRAGDAVGLEFTLPGQSRAIEAEADIVWADDSGHAGMRLAQLAPGCIQPLESWINDRCHEHEFAFVGRGGQAEPASFFDS